MSWNARWVLLPPLSPTQQWGGENLKAFVSRLAFVPQWSVYYSFKNKVALTIFMGP